MTSSAFNLNTFLQSYKDSNFTYDPTNRDAAAQQNMAAQDLQRAEEAVKQSGFLTLTLSEKMEELGIGERALQQFADTAVNMLTGAINPLEDYLEKYENIFDQNIYNSEIQAYAKQMFFASNAMRDQAAENPTGQKFVYTM